jgi:hypothetical protein
MRVEGQASVQEHSSLKGELSRLRNEVEAGLYLSLQFVQVMGKERLCSEQNLVKYTSERPYIGFLRVFLIE